MSKIRRVPDARYVGANHDRGSVRVTRKFPYRADIMACFQHMNGEGVAQGIRLAIFFGHKTTQYLLAAYSQSQ